jgi:segregation and condensation protein B
VEDLFVAGTEPAQPSIEESQTSADQPGQSSDVTALVEERPAAAEGAQLKAILEAIVYITDEPLSAQQIAAALGHPLDQVKRLLDELAAEYARPEHGLSIREIAGGYKMATKAEHHEAIRAFVKKLTPPLRLSLAALETLAVVAYKQPVTAPEIMEIRGVQGAGVLKTLLDRKLIAESGRKKVVGQPILYKTTKEFLVQFGLRDLNELPTLKEFEELGRLELVEETPVSQSDGSMSDGSVTEQAQADDANRSSAPLPTAEDA